jgi:hypothetical protein
MAQKHNPVRIFYSWQSDLPSETNQSAIRKAIEAYIAKSDTTFLLEEATRDESGSPNIPQTILTKIRSADLFIADISTINSADAPKRPSPNPNVVFELGYAVTFLGWKRIILLFNNSYGTFPKDVPFDFDRHRISHFKVPSSPRSQHLKRLGGLIEDAIDAVIIKDPQRPKDLLGLTPEELMRERDSRTLRWLLEGIHIPTVDDHISRLPHSFPDRSLFFYEHVVSLVFHNSLFHLYDEDLAKTVRKFALNWFRTVKREGLYHQAPGGHLHIFTNPGDMPLSGKLEKEWKRILKARQKMAVAFKHLLARVRADFIEIDLGKTNSAAWADYVQHEKSIRGMLTETDED